MSTIDLYQLSFAEVEALLAEMQQPAYRARQLWGWLYERLATSFDEMSNLPLSLRSALQQRATLGTLTPALRQHSKDGQTQKVLFELPDGQLIETVLMEYDKRRTACISTQAGCAMNCVFCATGQMGFYRNLTAGEIVAQVVFFAAELAKRDDRLTNIVMMGMGEPLHNYKPTMAAVDRITDAIGIGARRITISTVGLVPAIRRFADEQRQVGLAISLHAATDEERSKLLPINRRWSLQQLMEACDEYIDKTGRRLTFEWALIYGENDTVEQAERLGQLLQGMLCHVNLIPLNLTGGYSGGPSSAERTLAFQQRLSEYGVSSTVRVRRGLDIQAGCGQLRDRVIAERALQPGSKIDFSGG